MPKYNERRYKRTLHGGYVASLVLLVLLFTGGALQARILNEWGFYADPSGRTLSQATNTAAGTVSFSAGNEIGQATDGAGGLLCTQSVAGTTGMWTNGAVLNAALPVSSSTVRYLRYDFSYDLSDTNSLNNSGGVVGFSFYDQTHDKVAGVVLTRSAAASDASPYQEEDLVDVPTAGTVSVIARVGLDGAVAIWYSLTGDVSGFSETEPMTNLVAAVQSFDALRFIATGDVRPAGSTDQVTVDLLRTADTWASIVADEGVFVPSLGIAVTAPSGMENGTTSQVSIVVHNAGEDAQAVTTVLTHDGNPAGLVISSNPAPAFLAANASLTNTYTLIANTERSYNFTAQAKWDSTVGATTNFNIVVGSRVSYVSNSITEVGSFPLVGKYEPGETIDITVVSVNDGGLDVSNVVNSLSATSPFFSAPVVISPDAGHYDFLPIGAVTSTTYRVTVSASATNGTYNFVVTNRTATKVFSPDTFPLSVFSQAIPSVSPATVSLTPAVGNLASATVTVTNSGNAPLSFSTTDNAAWGDVFAADTNAVISTKETGGTLISLVDPDPANQWVEAATDGESATIDIGFSFPFYGTSYSKFYIDSNGGIYLSTTNRTPGMADRQTGDLPWGTRPMIAPLYDSGMTNPVGSVRYRLKSSPTRLVIVHDGVKALRSVTTNLQFQTELFTDGRIKFSYFNLDAPDHYATVGVQSGSGSAFNVGAVPASGSAFLLQSVPDRWVSWAPTPGSVPAFSSTNVTFTADASAQTVGTSISFDTIFNWSSSGISLGSNTVAVSATVSGPVTNLTCASAIGFSGNAGEMTFATLVLTNAGTVPVTYSITDSGSGVEYGGWIVSSGGWVDIPADATVVTNWIDPVPDNRYITATNEGYSALLPIGFSFPFYSGFYTNLSVGVNGGISVGETNRISAGTTFATTRADVPQLFIAPFWGNLFLDSNAKVSYWNTTNALVIAWENMDQSGFVPGVDIDFEAVLYHDGSIAFCYRNLNGNRWYQTMTGIRNGPGDYLYGYLATTNDAIVTTDAYGYAVTNYANTASDRYTWIGTTNRPPITHYPTTGTIPVGGTASITLTGDGTPYTPNGPNSITNMLSLSVDYGAGTNVVVVTFTVTNAVESVAVGAAATLDEDGDGMTYDQEIIAGTDPLSAGSVFSVRTDSGREISWTAAPDRTYTVWYTLSLGEEFKPLEGAAGLTTNRFTDALHADVPVIFYRVTVE